MSKKNFAHVRFERECAVDSAIQLSGNHGLLNKDKVYINNEFFFFKAIVFGSTAKRQRMPSTAAVGVCTWILLKHGTTSTNSSARLEDWSVNYVIDSASKRRSGGHLPLRQCLTTLNTKPMSLLSSSRCCSLVIPTFKKKIGNEILITGDLKVPLIF